MSARGIRMTDGHRADRQVVTWHSVELAELADLVWGNAEEQCAEALVDRGEQHEERSKPGVNIPVRHRPVCLVAVGPAFVLTRVTVEVDVLARQRHNYHRRQGDRVEGRSGVVLITVVVRQQLPERAQLLRALQGHQRVALAEPCGRRLVRGGQDPLNGLLGDGLVCIGAHHPPSPDHILELHASHPRAPAGHPGVPG